MKQFILGMVIAFLAGCSTPLAKPETPAQQLVYAEATLTAVVETTKTLYQSGQISRSDAANIEEQVENVILVFSNARLAIGKGDSKDALAYINQANKILVVLQGTLKAKANGK